MLAKRLVIVWVTIVSLLVTVACTPTIESEVGVAAPSSATQDALNTENSGGGVVVEVTPMSQAELAGQPQGQSESGASEGGKEAEREAQLGQILAETSAVYTDDVYQFRVAYPTDFVFRTQPVEKLTQLTPMPDASFIFMNPVTASSDLADLEPADLEIRVYAAEQIVSLDAWLTSVGLLPANGASPIQPFETSNVSGVQICASTLIAPGCSYFIMGRGWVYQLIPVTQEGEAIVNTFMAF